MEIASSKFSTTSEIVFVFLHVVTICVHIILRIGDEKIGEKYCTQTDASDGCTFFYVYGYSSSSNNTLYVQAQKEKACPLVQPLTGIIGGVVIGTLIIGLIILCIIKLLVNLKDKREYAHFKQETAASAFDRV